MFCQSWLGVCLLLDYYRLFWSVAKYEMLSELKYSRVIGTCDESF